MAILKTLLVQLLAATATILSCAALTFPAWYYEFYTTLVVVWLIAVPLSFSEWYAFWVRYFYTRAQIEQEMADSEADTETENEDSDDHLDLFSRN